MTDHVSTLPPELVEQLEAAVDLYEISLSQAIARAYNAGADAELEACVEWIRYTHTDDMSPDALRTARRLKPPSLKEQALTQLDSLHADLKNLGLGTNTDTIRRALEALPE